MKKKRIQRRGKKFWQVGDAAFLVLMGIAMFGIIIAGGLSKITSTSKPKQVTLVQTNSYKTDKDSLALHTLTEVTSTPTISPTPTPGPTAPPSNKIESCGTATTNSNEPDVLYAYKHEGGGAGGYADAIKLWTTDEHALTLGTGNVSPYNGDLKGAHVHNPNVGDLTQRDGPFPFAPTLFLTDITSNPNDVSGDAENGGTPIPPSDVYGAWKALGASDPGGSSTTTTSGGSIIIIGGYGQGNGWSNLAGGDPYPPQRNGPLATRPVLEDNWGSEIIWDVGSLMYKGQPLQSKHQYRAQFVVHDGDSQGDLGVGCVTLQIP